MKRVMPTSAVLRHLRFHTALMLIASLVGVIFGYLIFAAVTLFAGIIAGNAWAVCRVLANIELRCTGLYWDVHHYTNRPRG